MLSNLADVIHIIEIIDFNICYATFLADGNEVSCPNKISIAW